jgi:hypothetical protein
MQVAVGKMGAAPGTVTFALWQGLWLYSPLLAAGRRPCTMKLMARDNEVIRRGSCDNGVKDGTQTSSSGNRDQGRVTIGQM